MHERQRRIVGVLGLMATALMPHSAPAQNNADAETPESPRPEAEAPVSVPAVAVAAEVEIRLDGSLDEPAWSTAQPATGFRQREPGNGAPATEKTEVRVLFDSDHVYIGVWAYDSDPKRIIARQLERDTPLGIQRFGTRGGDDSIQLILDTFNDNRNAYYFATNAKGVMVDGLITDESERVDLSWDAVWDVRAQITASGWTAEIEIPYRTLRFRADPEGSSWGFNVERFIGRKNEQVLWTSWTRDGGGLTRVSLAGEITGLQLPNQGVTVALKPYTLGAAGRDYVESPTSGTDFNGEIGADAKLGFTSGLVLDLTVNTDFAQVEADDEQIDLTRFSLFFPEKREFFLENAGIFDFGSGGFFRAPQILLFFSRRIGIAETELADPTRVPMIAGARLTGRAGGQTIGFLDTVTGEQEALGVPLTNFAVARVKRDIGRRSYVGAIFTHRREQGGFTNLAGGVDATFWLSQPMKFEGFYARSQQTGPGGDDHSWRLNLDYTGDWLGWGAEHLEIGPQMEPGMGFVRRHDIARTRLVLRLTPRPPVSGLRKIDFFNSFQYVATADRRRLQDRVWSMNMTPQLNSGDRVRFEIQRRFLRLDEPFELETDVIIPVGDYEDWVFEARVNTSENRPFAVSVEGGVQDFWGGDRRRAGASAEFSSPHFGLALGYDHNDIDVPQGAFTTDLLTGRLKLALNTRLFWNSLIQYNSQTRAFSVNFRARFIHRPGSDLFIVFNERREIFDTRWNPVTRAFIVKITYLHWF